MLRRKAELCWYISIKRVYPKVDINNNGLGITYAKSLVSRAYRKVDVNNDGQGTYYVRPEC